MLIVQKTPHRSLFTCSSRLLKEHLQAEHTILSDTSRTRLDSLCLSSSNSVWKDIHSFQIDWNIQGTSLHYRTYSLTHTFRGWVSVSSLPQDGVHLPQPSESFIMRAQVEDGAVLGTSCHCWCSFLPLLLHHLMICLDIRNRETLSTFCKNDTFRWDIRNIINNTSLSLTTYSLFSLATSLPWAVNSLPTTSSIFKS